MIKVFISQPMKDRTEEEIRLTRAILERIAQKKLNNEAEIIESYFEDYPYTKGHKNIALKFLAKSIDRLADADVLIEFEDEGFARGCVIESRCAQYYGLICHKVDYSDLTNECTQDERERLSSLRYERRYGRK